MGFFYVFIYLFIQRPFGSVKAHSTTSCLFFFFFAFSEKQLVFFIFT